MWKKVTILISFLLIMINGCIVVDNVMAPATIENDEPLEASPIVTVVEATADPYSEARQRLVSEGIISWGIKNPEVIEVMGRTPRHEFVPLEYLDRAYSNNPLPIGYGQTISQPYIVALMTQELGVEAGDRVLEIGTGSGYQAAVLADLGVEVYTMEIIGPLAEAAADRLDKLGYDNVHVRHDDGYYGWSEKAPFDGVIVTAAPDNVPRPLLEQLKIGAVLVIPVGPVGGYQELWRITRVDEEQYMRKSLGGVRFVPFTRSEEGP